MVYFFPLGGTSRVKVLSTSQFSTFIDNILWLWQPFFTKFSIFPWNDTHNRVIIQKWENVPTYSCFGRIHTSITFLLFVSINPAFPIHPILRYFSC